MSVDGPTATVLGAIVAGIFLLLGQMLVFAGKRGDIAATRASTLAVQESALRADLYKINQDLTAQLEKMVLTKDALVAQIASVQTAAHTLQEAYDKLAAHAAKLEKRNKELEEARG